MKRLTREMRERLLRKSRWAEDKRFRRQGLGAEYGERVRQHRTSLARARSSVWPGPNQYVVRLEGALLLQADASGTLLQLRGLDDAMRKHRTVSHVRVIMDDLTGIDPAALLYMCSRIDRMSAFGLQVSGTWPKAEQVINTLVDASFTGFLEGRKPAFDAATRTLQLQRGSGKRRVRPEVAADVREFLRDLNPRLGVEDIDHINVAVMECVENVRVHAYSRRGDATGEKPWYLVGLHDPATHVSTVTILDVGVGMRSTVESQLNKVQKAFRWALQPTHELLKEATLGLRTETGERHRGKGLRTLRDFAVGATTRHLHVLSGDGMVTWSSKGPATRPVPRFDGTIVSLEIMTEGAS